MTKKKSALLVIDMQLVAFDGKITPSICNGSQLLDHTAALIAGCREALTPVIYLQTCAVSGQPYAKDVHGWEIHPQVQPRDDEVIFHKIGPSGFENPALDSYLQAHGIQHLLVCGCWSEGCVAFTCDSALEQGYATTLVADAHGTVRATVSAADKVVNDQNERFKARSVDVLPTQTVLQSLSIL